MNSAVSRALRGYALPVLLAAGLAGALLALDAQSQQQAIVKQSAMTFEPPTVSVRPGQSVTFVNDDPFGHNVYSLTPGGEFDIGLQAPGESSIVPFARAGTFDVRCRIHPKMRAQVVVR